jgi:hypothetical protein
VRSFFEAIDEMPADSTFVIVGVVIVALIAERIFRELEYRYRAAIERIDGYIAGFRDGDAHRMPAVNVEREAKVPDAFTRGMR